MWMCLHRLFSPLKLSILAFQSETALVAKCLSHCDPAAQEQCMWGINLIKSSHILKWKHLSVDAASPIGIFFWTTLLTRLWDPPTSGCKKVPWPILSGGRLNSKSDSSSCDGICNNIWWHHSYVKYYYSQIISLCLSLFFKCAIHTSERCSDNFSPEFLAFCRAGSRSLPWPTLKWKLHYHVK